MRLPVGHPPSPRGHLPARSGGARARPRLLARVSVPPSRALFASFARRAPSRFPEHARASSTSRRRSSVAPEEGSTDTAGRSILARGDDAPPRLDPGAPPLSDIPRAHPRVRALDRPRACADRAAGAVRGPRRAQARGGQLRGGVSGRVGRRVLHDARRRLRRGGVE